MLYILTMTDPGSAAFCTFYKKYAGSMDDMQVIYNAIKEKELNYGPDPIAKSMEEYWAGNKGVRNKGVYLDMPIFQEVTEDDIVAQNNCKIKNTQFDHKNTWGYVYPMRCDQVDMEYIVARTKCDELYTLFIRPEFTNLKYENTFRKVAPLTDIIDDFWGNPGVLSVEGKGDNTIIKANVYIEVASFTAKEDAIDAISEKDKLISYMGSIMDEVFGDG